MSSHLICWLDFGGNTVHIFEIMRVWIMRNVEKLFPFQFTNLVELPTTLQNELKEQLVAEI
jgi:hypothetical protein